jgi:CxxC motif-containing protein (DUF1111 family)
MVNMVSESETEETSKTSKSETEATLLSAPTMGVETTLCARCAMALVGVAVVLAIAHATVRLQIGRPKHKPECHAHA